MAQAPPRQVGQHLFTPVAHPQLRKLGRKNIRNFLRDRKQYMLRIADARACGSLVTAVSIKASIDFDLLQSLLFVGEFGDVKSYDELTDDTIERWLEGMDDARKIELTKEEIDAAVAKSVRINVNEEDPRLRIIGLFSDYTTFLRTIKRENLIKENTKVAVEHICSLLKPTVLRQRIECDLKLEQKALKTDWRAFSQFVLTKAVAYDEFVPTRKHKASTPSTPKPPTAKPSWQSGVTFTLKAPLKVAPTAQKNKTAATTSNRGGTSNPSTAAPADPPPPFCLNKLTCLNKRHFIRDCEDTPKEQKMELYRQAREERAKNPTASAVTTANETGSNQFHNGRYSGTLADAVEVIVNADYGADHSALSEKHLQQCAEKGVFVNMLPLAKPIVMRLAADSPEASDAQQQGNIEAHSKARITTAIITPVGPLRLRNVEYLVFRDDMPEVLFSRPLLQTLGFDFNEHLAKVHENVHDMDYSRVGFAPDHTVITAESPPPRTALAKLLHSPTHQEIDSLPLEKDPLHFTPVSPVEETLETLDLQDYRSEPQDLVGDENPEMTDACLLDVLEDAVTHACPRGSKVIFLRYCRSLEMSFARDSVATSLTDYRRSPFD